MHKIDDTATKEDLDNTGDDPNFKMKYGEPVNIKFGQWEGNTTKDVLNNDPGYILWVNQNFDDPSDYAASEVEQMKDMVDEAKRRLEEREESEHVGKEGERDKFEVSIKKSIAYEKKGKRKRVVVFRDKDNNRFTTFLSRSSDLSYDLNRAAPKNNNENLLIEAKVVSHKEYEGEADTILANVDIIENGIGELELESPDKGESRREKWLNSIVDDFFEQWQDVFIGRIRKFSRARRVLKNKPFMDEEIEKLDRVFQTLIDTHESRKENVKDLQSKGYGTVQGDFNL